jgi:hypothetical protein
MPTKTPPSPGPVGAARLGAVVAATALLLILFGCMSFNIERPAPPPVQFTGPVADAQPLEQRGEVHVLANREVEVIYPVPYLSRPNLTVETGSGGHVAATEQRTDCFRVRNTGLFDHKVTWVAKGVSILKAPPPPPVEALPEVPEPVAGPVPTPVPK